MRWNRPPTEPGPTAKALGAYVISCKGCGCTAGLAMGQPFCAVCANELLKELEESARELVGIVDDPECDTDSFTSQPVKAVLNVIEGKFSEPDFDIPEESRAMYFDVLTKALAALKERFLTEDDWTFTLAQSMAVAEVDGELVNKGVNFLEISIRKKNVTHPRLRHGSTRGATFTSWQDLEESK